mgnify:CR=1 FL=1
MNPTPTEIYVSRLTALKTGELAMLRSHTGQGIDRSVAAFDLFSGIWWPLREKNQRAPRRQVAWLVAKLFASCPVDHAPHHPLPSQLSRCRIQDERQDRRLAQKFDDLLMQPLIDIENPLRWAIGVVESHNLKLDWVRLTDDLSIWDRETTRLRWAGQFLDSNEGSGLC